LRQLSQSAWSGIPGVQVGELSENPAAFRRQEKGTIPMTAAYLIFAMAIAIAVAFVLTIRIWIRHEDDIAHR